MRILGVLFLLVLLLAVVGWFRGWFSITTVEAHDKSSVSVAVDEEKIGDDADAVANKLEQWSEKTEQAVRSLGREVGPGTSAIEGTLAAVDPATREITVDCGPTSLTLHAGDGVDVTRDGASIAFDRLQPTQRVRLVFRERSLAAIEILR